MNQSLQKKSAARLAAVQCLYQAAITGEAGAPEAQVAALKKQLANNAGEQKIMVGSAIEPNYALVESLLTGVAANREEIFFRLDSVLSGEWKRERMSKLLVAILECAIFELFFSKEIAPKIIIDEYTRLTRSFFADAEVNFAHGALGTLVQKYHG